MSKKYTLYKIYYDDNLVYIGRTKQRLQDRIRGHLFKKPMHKAIDINYVSKIEYAELKTEADMFLYEIYLINKYKPIFNCDDKAKDELTVTLPSIKFEQFTTPLWNKWVKEINEKESEYRENMRKEKEMEKDWRERKRNAFEELKSGKLSHEEYEKIIEDIQNEKIKAMYAKGEIDFEEYCLELNYTKLN
jgi:hypothetical protein